MNSEYIKSLIGKTISVLHNYQDNSYFLAEIVKVIMPTIEEGAVITSDVVDTPVLLILCHTHPSGARVFLMAQCHLELTLYNIERVGENAMIPTHTELFTLNPDGIPVSGCFSPQQAGEVFNSVGRFCLDFIPQQVGQVNNVLH